MDLKKTLTDKHNLNIKQHTKVLIKPTFIRKKPLIRLNQASRCKIPTNLPRKIKRTDTAKRALRGLVCHFLQRERNFLTFHDGRETLISP